jgi:hypothetical protein
VTRALSCLLFCKDSRLRLLDSLIARRRRTTHPVCHLSSANVDRISTNPSLSQEDYKPQDNRLIGYPKPPTREPESADYTRSVTTVDTQWD